MKETSAEVSASVTRPSLPPVCRLWNCRRSFHACGSIFLQTGSKLNIWAFTTPELHTLTQQVLFCTALILFNQTNVCCLIPQMDSHFTLQCYVFTIFGSVVQPWVGGSGLCQTGSVFAALDQRGRQRSHSCRVTVWESGRQQTHSCMWVSEEPLYGQTKALRQIIRVLIMCKLSLKLTFCTLILVFVFVRLDSDCALTVFGH